MRQNDIRNFLLKQNINFTENGDMSRITSMRCGGRARFLAVPNNEDSLVSLVRFLREENIVYKVVGGMTNTLPCDGIYEGVLIRTVGINSVEFTENNMATVGAGALLSVFVKYAAERNFGGFEELSGIPGTVGGALYGNSGAHSVSISSMTVSVKVYDVEQDRVIELDNDELDYGYRSSFFKNNTPDFTVLGAKLRGVYRDKKEIYERIKTLSQIRRDRQPLNMPSLGSVFKHPQGDFAPRIIEELRLKGLSHGGAAISEKHAGFIVNNGNATSADVRSLIKIIKEKVEAEYGILLEEEIDIM